MKQVDIYTDGACSGNPGPGGWAAVLIYQNTEKQICGFIDETTNNRMELFSAIQALAALKEPCQVRLYSDSSYLIHAFEKGWLSQWRQNGWKNASKQPVENQDLWKALLLYAEKHHISWMKVKGHTDNPYNNQCDALAREQIKKNRIKTMGETIHNYM